MSTIGGVTAGVLGVAAILFFSAGCGGTSHAEPKTSAGEDMPRTEEDARALLDRSEAELAAIVGPIGGEAAYAQPAPTASVSPAPSGSAGTPPSDPTSPPPQPRHAEATVQTGTGAIGVSEGDGPARDSCGVACRALASMERAATRICTIAMTETTPTCVSARERVERASARVHAMCTCG